MELRHAANPVENVIRTYCEDEVEDAAGKCVWCLHGS